MEIIFMMQEREEQKKKKVQEWIKLLENVFEGKIVWLHNIKKDT